jgi:hypothetical protein
MEETMAFLMAPTSLPGVVIPTPKSAPGTKRKRKPSPLNKPIKKKNIKKEKANKKEKQ